MDGTGQAPNGWGASGMPLTADARSPSAAAAATGAAPDGPVFRSFFTRYADGKFEVAGWERPNWFAPEGVPREDHWSFRRSKWFEHVGEECRQRSDPAGRIRPGGPAPTRGLPVFRPRPDQRQMDLGDGMLGQAWFGDRIWTFDYAAGRLLLHPEGSSAIPEDAPTTDLGFRTDSLGNRLTHFPRVQAVVDGDTLDFLLDTGAGISDVVRAQTVRGRGSADPDRPFRRATVLHDSRVRCTDEQRPDASCGAVIEIFRKKSRAATRARTADAGDGRVLRRGRYVLLVSPELDRAAARSYRSAFRETTRDRGEG